MIRTALLLCAGLLGACLAGCGQPVPDDKGQPAPGRVVIPGPGEVSAVVVRVEGGPGNEAQFLGAPFELRLTRRDDVAEVLDWLKGFDWSREGTDLKAIHLSLGGSIEVVRTEGPPLKFLYTWDGVIYENQLRGGDTARLQGVIRRVRKEG